MSQCQRTRSAPETAAALEAQLRAAGYQPGYPGHVAPMTRAVDASTARRMKCPACKRRGLGAKAFHKETSFRVLTVCASCGAAGDEI